MKNESQSQSSALSSGASTCVIAPGTYLEGQFSSSEQVRFDGHLVGDISCGNKLVVGAQGLIEGAVEAREVVIMGKVKGDIKAGKYLHLRKGAFVAGKINSPDLSIEEGATFEGESRTQA